MCQCAPLLVALPGLFDEPHVIETQFSGHLCTPEMPATLNAPELTSMITSASLARSLRSVVDDPVRMRLTSMASWARKRQQRRVLGSALWTPLSEKAGKLSFTMTQQGQELHVLKILSLAKDIGEGRLQCIIFAISEQGQDDSLNFSGCDVVQGCNNMTELNQVYCNGWGVSCKLGLHLAEQHLWLYDLKGRELDRDR